MRQEPEPPQDRFITANGLRLHYLEWGKPGQKTIILLHGFNNCAATWIPLAGKLAPRRHVLALDQRGHGDSQWSEGGFYRNEYLAGDLAAFIEALNLKRVSLIGHSMGGNVALKYAATHPEKVARLVIVDIGPEMSRRVETRAAQMLSMKKDVYPSLDEAAAYLEAADPLAARELLLQEAAYLTRRLPDGGFTWKQHQMFLGGNAPKPAGPVSARNEEKWQMMRRVTCPTLVLRGEESDILDEEVARKMVAEIPLGEMVNIAGAGHYVHRDNPARFEKEVRHFLGLKSPSRN
ncbi:MAG: alpha/beta hydrolase [Chloroflexota bacterium]